MRDYAGRGEITPFFSVIQPENQISILSSNVRGIINNWDAIKNVNWRDYDFLAFNEIWAIKDFESLQIDEYEIKSVKTRFNRRGGGVIIFGKKELRCEIITTPFIEGTFESIGIKVDKLVIINVYRPPSGNVNTFLDELANLLESFSSNKIVLTGDFNINFLVNSNAIHNLCRQFGLQARINKVTRLASGTCLDNFLTNLNGIYSVSNICIADHLAIKAKIRITSRIKKIKAKHTYKVMKEHNWLLFKAGIYNLAPIGNTVEQRWESTTAQVKGVIESSFPLKSTYKKYNFTMSKGLLKSRARKNKLLKDFKAGKISKGVYINYNRLYRKLVVAETKK